MTTISKDTKLLTLINVFTVEPAKQQELVALLIHATQSSVRHAKGFISASLHRSLDGTRVAMYAQWRSVEDYQAMRNSPTCSRQSRSHGLSWECMRSSRPGANRSDGFRPRRPAG